jgi:hypothetical protein
VLAHFPLTAGESEASSYGLHTTPYQAEAPARAGGDLLQRPERGQVRLCPVHTNSLLMASALNDVIFEARLDNLIKGLYKLMLKAIQIHISSHTPAQLTADQVPEARQHTLCMCEVGT